MITIEFGIEIAAEHVEARADVTAKLAPPEHFGHRAGCLPPPDLELEESILRRGVSLREEQVGLVLRVDVIDAPAVADDLDRLRQSRRLKRRRGRSLSAPARRQRDRNQHCDQDPARHHILQGAGLSAAAALETRRPLWRDHAEARVSLCERRRAGSRLPPTIYS